MTWIKCSERLPDLNQTVLVYVRDYEISMARFENVDPNLLKLKKITHWMPIPTPPEDI